MKVKNYVEKSMSLNRRTEPAESCEMPPLEKIIVRITRPYEFEDYSSILVGIESVPEYSANAISYNVRSEYKAKVEAIANFIGKNKGKRLLDVLEMDLP